MVKVRQQELEQEVGEMGNDVIKTEKGEPQGKLGGK